MGIFLCKRNVNAFRRIAAFLEAFIENNNISLVTEISKFLLPTKFCFVLRKF